MIPCWKAIGLLSLTLLLGGCEAIGSVLSLLAPGTVEVRLVNHSDFAVQVRLFLDDDQELPRDVLTEEGTELEFAVAPGETTAFSRNCEDLQIIVIDHADLMVIGAVGPETSSDVLRDGDDFGCGDAIIFTFDHSDVIVDFDVSVSVQSE